MISRPRNYYNPSSDRSNIRQEKIRNISNFHVQESAQGDGTEKTTHNENRYMKGSKNYTLDTETEDDYKLNDDRSSNEDDYTNGINAAEIEDTDYRAYGTTETKQRDTLAQDTTYAYQANQGTKHLPTYNTENYENSPFRSKIPKKSQEYGERKAYGTAVDPESILPTHKLQTIRELQRLRDFYSSEISRLTGDWYYDQPKPTSPIGNRQQEKRLPQIYENDRITSNLHHLERCGTITTMTQLDCGCSEQLTRTLFTTTTGRIIKRNCSPDQQVQLKINPKTSFMLDNHQVQTTCPKLKNKSFNDPRNHISSKSFDSQTTNRPLSPIRNNSESHIN